MKRLALFGAVLLWSGGVFVSNPAGAATNAEIATAATNGINWLAAQQNPDGSWGAGSYLTAKTCFALLKLEDRACDEGYSNPFDPAYGFSDEIIDGWNYVFTDGRTAKRMPLPPQDHTTGATGTIDDPDTNGNGYGVYFPGTSGRDSYTTGICLMALTHEREKDYLGNPCPVQMPLDRPNEGGLDFDGDSAVDTYGEIAQEAADWLAYAQTDSGYGEGGWDYPATDNSGPRSDNSISGYTTMGLAAAEARGLTVPAWVKTELNHWVNYIQSADGGSGYTSPGSSSQLRTGNLIFQMTFVGDTPATPRFQKALQYIEDHWRDTNYNPGWGYNVGVSEYQAMYTLMKGLAYSGVALIDTDGDGLSDNPWYNQDPSLTPAQDFVSNLVAQQNAAGSWPSGCTNGDAILCTVWPWLTLKAVIPQPPVDCAILAGADVRLLGGTQVVAEPADVCSNNGMTLGASVSVDSSLLALGEIVIRANSVIGQDVQTNGDLRCGGNLSIGGQCDVGGIQYGDCGCNAVSPDLQPFEMPQCTVTPPAEGAPDLKGCVAVLSPGDYGDVVLTCDVEIEAGEYHVERLRFAPGIKVDIQGPITVHAANGVRFDSDVKQHLAPGVDASQIVYYVQGALGAHAGNDAEIYGTLCGPASRIVIRAGSALTGGIIAEEIVMGPNVSFSADPAIVP